MDITPLIPKSSQVVQGYGLDGYKVSGQHFEKAVIVTPEQSFEWSVTSVENLTRSDFSFLDDLDFVPEVLLFGTGNKMIFPPNDVRNFFDEKMELPPIEAMDSGAACRTYNTLLADGRRVIACLLPMGQ